jgi:inhibitor of KinA sporulation pathway (predicted exonuclease)
MGSKLDKVLVIDIESTCWEKNPPANEISDIIEIGVCTVDVQSLKIEDKTSILIKPSRSKVSPFCTQLTTLTQEMVDTGVTFAEAAQILQKKFNSSDRAWASWGEYDKNMFNKHSVDFNVKYPLGRTHFNLKALFSIFKRLPKEVGLDEALKLLNLPLDGTHHRGHDDAANIAKIFAHMLKNQSI